MAAFTRLSLARQYLLVSFVVMLLAMFAIGTFVARQIEAQVIERTERERDVLCLVGKGLTNREIGEQLHLAEKTVKHYMTNVLQKLQVRTRVEAALWVQRNYEHGQMCEG